MSRLFLALSFILAVPLSAQPLTIVDIERPTPRQPAAGELISVPLVVRVQNTGRTARFAYVTAQADGQPETARVISDARIEPGDRDRIRVPLDIDLRTVSPDPTTVEVRLRVYTNTTTVVDTETIRLSVTPRERPTVVAVDVVEMTIPPIAVPATDEGGPRSLTLRITTGRDDRRNGTRLFVTAVDAQGRLLSTPGGASRGTLVDLSETSGPGETQSGLLPLRAPTAPNQIHRLVLWGGVDMGTSRLDHTEDNWDIARLDVFAGEQSLAVFEGRPFNRFTWKVPLRVVQVASPDMNAMTESLGIAILSGSDDLRGGGRVTAQALDRSGHPLSAAVQLNPDDETWDEDSHVIARLPLTSRTRVGDIGSVVIDHESRSQGVQSSDNWDVARIEIISEGPSTRLERFWMDGTSAYWERPWSILSTSEGAPLHRFSDGSRRLVVPVN